MRLTWPAGAYTLTIYTPWASVDRQGILHGQTDRLTKAGRAHLKREVATWERLSSAVNLIIQQA